MILGAAAGLVPGAAPAPLNASLNEPALSFRVLRNDSQIGTHVLTFAAAAGTRTIRVATDIRVGLGPVTFYRYTHRAEERWRDGVFVWLEAETNDDGTIGRTSIRREGSTLTAEGREAPSYQPPPDALPMTHWNRGSLDRPLISTQSGRLLRPVVTRAGPSSVTTAKGAISAEQFTLRGDPELDSWYDQEGAWAGLRLTARDGSTIRYQRD